MCVVDEVEGRGRVEVDVCVVRVVDEVEGGRQRKGGG